MYRQTRESDRQIGGRLERLEVIIPRLRNGGGEGRGEMESAVDGPHRYCRVSSWSNRNGTSVQTHLNV